VARPANEPSKTRIAVARTRLGLAIARLGLLEEPKPYLGLGLVRPSGPILFSGSARRSQAERTVISDSARCARWDVSRNADQHVAIVTHLVTHKSPPI
jgi:hypothetical protein